MAGNDRTTAERTQARECSQLLWAVGSGDGTPGLGLSAPSARGHEVTSPGRTLSACAASHQPLHKPCNFPSPQPLTASTSASRRLHPVHDAMAAQLISAQAPREQHHSCASRPIRSVAFTCTSSLTPADGVLAVHADWQANMSCSLTRGWYIKKLCGSVGRGGCSLTSSPFEPLRHTGRMPTHVQSHVRRITVRVRLMCTAATAASPA